ncbi:MAG: InlB B-repeat-containing protein [Firmicutes bacterium]|nr:InlB B-repeat-containing protein [Bacillota bacterium]
MGKFSLPKVGKQSKRVISIVLSVALLASAIAIAGSVQSGAMLTVTSAASLPKVLIFGAPETIYVNPLNNRTQYFANNFGANSTVNNWIQVNADIKNNTIGRGEHTAGYIHFNYPGVNTAPILTLDDNGGTGYVQTISAAAGGSGNWNWTISNNTTTISKSGLLRWKVVFTLGDGELESYCYSYIHKTDARAITGSTSASTPNVGSCYDSYYDSGAFIIGVHYGLKPPDGGNRNANATLQSRLFGNTWTSALNRGNDTTDSATAGEGGISASGTKSYSGTTYWDPNNDESPAAKGYIVVDTSRYGNLNQIPQLKFVHVIMRADVTTSNGVAGAYNGESSVITGVNSSGKHGIWGAYTENDVGSWYENPIGNPIGGAGAVEYTGTAATYGGVTATGGTGHNMSRISYGIPYYGSLNTAINAGVPSGEATALGVYTWWGYGQSTALINSADSLSRHRNGATVEWTARNKENLRDQMQKEISSMEQYMSMRGWLGYRANLEALALALCQPDYPFNGATVATDLANSNLAGSLAYKVVLARDALQPQTGQAEMEYRNAITGGLIPMYVPGNMVPYTLGDSVVSDYDHALDLPVGYKTDPVAVSVPYIDAGVVKTDITPPGLPATAAPALGRYLAPVSPGTRAPDGAGSPNQAVKVQNLKWVWWIQPIEYKLRLRNGGGSAGGGYIEIPMYYGQEFNMLGAVGSPQEVLVPASPVTGTKITAPTAPATGNWELAGWRIATGTKAGSVYDIGEGVRNLTIDNGDIIYADAIWVDTGNLNTDTFVFDWGPPDVDVGSQNANGGAVLNKTVTMSGIPAGTLVASVPRPGGAQRAGYTFGQWWLDAAYTEAVILNPRPFETTDRKAFAKWIPLTYKIQYRANTGTGTVSDETVEYDADATTALSDGSALTKTGYIFEGWSLSNVAADTIGPARKPLTTTVGHFPGSTLVKYSNLYAAAPALGAASISPVTLYARWAPEKFVVTLNYNYGTPVPSDGPEPSETRDRYFGSTYGEKPLAAPSTLTTPDALPVPTRFGFIFAGWNSQANGLGTTINDGLLLNNQFFVQNVDHTIYAIWKTGTPVTVTIDTDGGVPASVGTAYTGAVLGETIPLSVFVPYQPTKAGWAFDHWEIDQPASPAPPSAKFVPGYADVQAAGHTGIELNGNTKLKAVYTPNQYVVRYYANYAGAADPFKLSGGPVLTISNPDEPMVGQDARDGYNLAGYTYREDNTGVFLPYTGTQSTPALLSMLADTSLQQEGAGPTILKLYAKWEPKVVPGTGEDDPGPNPAVPPIPVDPPVGPPWNPGDLDDNDPDPQTADDGYIVMYYVRGEAGVTFPAGTASRKYLEYDKNYGYGPALPAASKAATATQTFVPNGKWEVMRCGHGTAGFPVGAVITAGDIVKHECSIWVKPLFDAYDILPPPPPPTCWERIQACLTTTRNKITKFFFPLLSLGLPLLNYGIPNLTVEMVFDLPFHTLFLGCIFGLVVMPIFLIVPSWFTVIHEMAPGWWPNVKRFYLL